MLHVSTRSTRLSLRKKRSVCSVVEMKPVIILSASVED